jgi:hypothetical protein
MRAMRKVSAVKLKYFLRWAWTTPSNMFQGSERLLTMKYERHLLSCDALTLPYSLVERLLHGFTSPRREGKRGNPKNR